MLASNTSTMCQILICGNNVYTTMSVQGYSQHNTGQLIASLTRVLWWELLTNSTHARLLLLLGHCVPKLNYSHTFCYYCLLILSSDSHINGFRVPLLYLFSIKDRRKYFNSTISQSKRVMCNASMLSEETLFE